MKKIDTEPGSCRCMVKDRREACFRIQREAIEAAGHFIPLVVENVRGAQKWVTMVATTAICVLHGTYGREFTDGYLSGARRAMDDPAEAAPIEVQERKMQ